MNWPGHAGVSPSTASAHLPLLVDGGLLTQERQGQHRYVRLADPATAQLVEDLAAHADAGPPAHTLRAATRQRAVARARTCYDHLAGQLGVAVTDALLDAGWLQQRTGFALTDAGLHWLTGRPSAAGPGLPRLDRTPAASGRDGRRGAVPARTRSGLGGPRRHRPGAAGHRSGPGRAARPARHRPALRPHRR